MSQSVFEKVLPPVYLEKGDTVIEGPNASIQLRRFQDEVLDFFLSSARSLLLKAPTGSGKTLTTLLPLAARTLGGREYYGVLAVYPTKALVEDQYLSVRMIVEKLGGVVEHSDNYVVAELDLTVYRKGRLRSKRWRIALAKLTRENVSLLASLLGEEERPRRYVLNKFVERLTSVHNIEYVVVFAVPEYPYLLLTRMYSTPRAWKLLDKIVTGEVLDILEEYAHRDRVRAHKKAVELMGGTYLGKVLYDVLASLGNVFFIDEFHVWKGFEKPTVEAMVSAMSTIAKIHLIDTRFVFSSATPLKLSEEVRKSISPLVEVKAKPSSSGDTIRGPTRLRIVSARVRGGGASAWMQTDNYLSELVANEYPSLHSSKRFMVIGRRNYNVEKAAEVFYELTSARPVIVTGVNPPAWADGREVLAKLKDSGFLPLFGNFAVELGVDLSNIRYGIVTAATHGELVQRIGRIGRGDTESTIVVPVPHLYFNGIKTELERAKDYVEALEVFEEYMDKELPVEECYERSSSLIKIAKLRILMALSAVALSLVTSDKYQDKTYEEFINNYLNIIGELWDQVGYWLVTRVARTAHTLLTLASFRLGVQVKYSRNGTEDYASLSTLLSNYAVTIDGDKLVVEGLEKARLRDVFVVSSMAYEDEWEPLYDKILPASLVARLGKLEGSLLADILAMIDDPVYVSDPDDTCMGVLKVYGQAVEVKPVAGTGPLAYLVLL